MRRTLLVSLIHILIAAPVMGYCGIPILNLEGVSKGYIITTRDTLEVFIKNQPSYDHGIQYKPDIASDKYLTLESNEVISLVCDNTRYQRINTGTKSVLAKVVRTGKVTLFEHTEISYSTRHVYDKKSGNFLPTDGYVETKRYYLEKNATIHYVGDFSSYKRNLKRVLNEKPEIQLLIKKMRYRYLEYELDRVVSSYNEHALLN